MDERAEAIKRRESGVDSGVGDKRNSDTTLQQDENIENIEKTEYGDIDRRGSV